MGTSGIKWTDELDLDADTIYQDGSVVSIKESIDNFLIGFKLKSERINKGLSQQEVSNLTGIEQSDISKIENGDANPTIQTLRRLCNCYNKKLKIDLINFI